MKITTAILFSSVLMTPTVNAGDFKVTSPQINAGERIDHEQIFNGFGCEGDNVSPALKWQGAPVGTKSFAITMYDPDAPTGSGWWHWVAFNIPADVTNLAKGASSDNQKLPKDIIQSHTDFGKPGYGGPCPPQGDDPHRFQITVYALKTDKLPLDENAPAAMVGFYLHQNLIEKAVLQAHYSR